MIVIIVARMQIDEGLCYTLHNEGKSFLKTHLYHYYILYRLLIHQNDNVLKTLFFKRHYTYFELVIIF